MAPLAALVKELHSTPIDRESVSRDRLDLGRRKRLSSFPWRGQFSPDLVTHLLAEYAPTSGSVLDPFAGAGTVLEESARVQLVAVGAEINPAAIVFCKVLSLCPLSTQDRVALIAELEARWRAVQGTPLGGGLFGGSAEVVVLDLDETVRAVIGGSPTGDLDLLLEASVLLAFGHGNSATSRSVANALGRIRRILFDLPESQDYPVAHWADARALPVESNSIGLVITSPPYINVFNYHQNYRKAVEALGYRPLAIAKSEIGSNRKHRANRFLTVTQYCIDLMQTFCELRRVLESHGKIVFVIGRTSNVLGTSFANYEAAALLAMGGAGLRLARRQERLFTTRFGEPIFEDILTFEPNGEANPCATAFAREVGERLLSTALVSASPETRSLIEAAIEAVPTTAASPVLASDVQRECKVATLP